MGMQAVADAMARLERVLRRRPESGLSADAKVLTEEPFAPVMPVLDFGKIDDVIAAANNTQYGLAAYVFTNDLSVAWRMAEGLEAGIIGAGESVLAVVTGSGLKDARTAMTAAGQPVTLAASDDAVDAHLDERPLG